MAVGTCCCRSISVFKCSSCRFFDFCPAAYSPEEKITSQKESEQGRQPREGLTSNATIFSSKPITPTLWRGRGAVKASAVLPWRCRGPFLKDRLEATWKTATYPVCSRPHSNTKGSFLTGLLSAAVNWHVSAWGKSEVRGVQFNHRPHVWRTGMRQRSMNELTGTKQPVTFDKPWILTLLAQVLSAFLIHCMCHIYGFFFLPGCWETVTFFLLQSYYKVKLWRFNILKLCL